MIYHFVGHEILNKTLYFVKRYYSQILRYLRKCMKKFDIIEWIKMLLHKLRHEVPLHCAHNPLLFQVKVKLLSKSITGRIIRIKIIFRKT